MLRDCYISWVSSLVFCTVCIYQSSENINFGWNLLTLVLLTLDMPCLCKQCRSRSFGFFRSQLSWICTVCHSVFEYISKYISTTWIKKSDWLKIRSRHGILIYSAWQGLNSYLLILQKTCFDNFSCSNLDQALVSQNAGEFLRGSI